MSPAAAGHAWGAGENRPNADDAPDALTLLRDIRDELVTLNQTIAQLDRDLRARFLPARNVFGRGRGAER